jgi:hypothetical protein
LQGEYDTAEEIYSGRFKVSLGKPGLLICKVPFMGLYKLKVQLNYGHLNVSSRKKEETAEKQKRIIVMQEKIKKVAKKKYLSL